MKIELDVPQELMESIKNQIAEYEKENQKPKDVINYVYGYVITERGFVRTITMDNDEVKNLFTLGLYRDTKEEAEKLLRKMQIEHRLRQWAKMCKEKVDWKNSLQSKYYILYDVDGKIVSIDALYTNLCNDVYFTDKSILQCAIENIGEQNLIDNYFVEV